MYRRFIDSDYLAILFCIVLVVVASGTIDGFASQRNAVNVLAVAAPLLILALGQMLVMISGGIDLSATAIMAATSVAGASLMTEDQGLLAGNDWAVPLACLAMPLLGAAIGLANGASVAWLRMPPFIATLTSMMFLYAVAKWVTQSHEIGSLPLIFIRLGTRIELRLSLAILLAVAVGVGLSFTKYGRWLYAVGQSPPTALVSRVPVRAVQCATYCLGGLLAGLASIFHTAELETGSPVLGEKTLMLDVIGAVVIGGTSLFGGKGKVSWTLGGVLFLVLLDNILGLQNMSHFAVGMSKGAVILLAILLDSLRHRGSGA